VLKERLAGKVLEMRILHPAGDHSLVRRSERVLEVEQPRHQPRRGRRSTRRGREEPGPFAFEEVPVDQRRQRNQLVAQVDHVNAARTEEVVLLGRTGTVLHAANQNCRITGRIP
jgi:hypothetical protein